MIAKIVLKTVRYTEHMTEAAREVVDRFNYYANTLSGALEDHLCLDPLSGDTLEDLIDEGAYEYTSQNPYFGALKNVLDDLWNAAVPYHNTPWEEDILDVLYA